MTTILARDLKPGDVIDFGGQPITLSEHTNTGETCEKTVSRVYLDWSGGGTTLPADLPLNVQRPDPDAELVEVMARAIRDAYAERILSDSWAERILSDGWDDMTDKGRENVRSDARAALAAAREAGLL